MFLQTTAEFDHHFGINATIHERKRGDKMKVKILYFGKLEAGTGDITWQ